jgi:hypothetical protein
MIDPLGDPLEILKLLDGSNCRKCGKPTCMAFALAVYSGQKQLDECPTATGHDISRGPAGATARPARSVQDFELMLEQLAGEVASIDLAAAAKRLGASYANGKLTIKCLGKDFSVDEQGTISTELHVHGWLAGPAMSYIIGGGGTPPSGTWVSYQDLPGGKARYPLFAQRCERPCQQLADADVELFADIVGLFGTATENQGSSDLSVVLTPLPRVPLLIRYWKPEDGLESNLSFLFDSTAAANLNIEALYVLATGLVVMFEKIALKHGRRG